MSFQDASFDHGRIRLTPAGPEDLPGWRVFMQDPEVMQFIFGGWTPDDEELQALLTRNVHNWHRYGMGWWTVRERSTMQTIANCVLDISCSGASEIGYIIRKESWRQGIGKEIVEALCQYAFEIEELDALKAYVNVANEGSIRLLEKLGFTRDSEAVFAGRPCFNFGMKKEGFDSIHRGRMQAL